MGWKEFYENYSYLKTSRDYQLLVKWSCRQRSVRYQDYLYIRTCHDGFHFFPKHVVQFKNDPYEQKNLASEKPDVVNMCVSLLYDWHDEMMKKTGYAEDPLAVVMREGGPFHARKQLKRYLPYLEETGRGHYIEEYKKVHPEEFE